MGEGESMGPLTAAMKTELVELQTDIKYSVEWTTLREYLDWLVRRGVTPNVGSFLGAVMLRVFALGRENRESSSDELRQMQAIVKQAMDEGAFGIVFALIYTP